MAMFVHLAPLSRTDRICRSGIRPRAKSELHPGCVFAVPVTRNFMVSHQWLRELKRRNSGPIAAVYFRIPDEDTVYVAHYRQEHRHVTAAQAVAIFLEAEDRLGWEVLIPRRVESSEIHRVRQLPQVVGWRYWPGANGRPPFCTCKFCTRGEYGAAKLRRRLGASDE